jgi:hypothetical protein
VRQLAGVGFGGEAAKPAATVPPPGHRVAAGCSTMSDGRLTWSAAPLNLFDNPIADGI